MIVDCAVYRDGVRVPQVAERSDLQAALATVDGDHDFVWVGLHEPSVQELREVSEAFHLHQLAVEDAYRAHQRPKLEPYDNGFFVVLKTLWYVEAEDGVETGEINMFVGDGYIVTVRHGAGAELGETRRDLERRASVLGHGPGAVVYAVCDRVVDEYESVARSVAEDVDEVEQEVFSTGRPSSAAAQRIYTLKRELLEFRRAVVPLRDPMARLAAGGVPAVGEQARPFFRDIYDHVVRVSEQVESLDTLLSGILAAQFTRISVQQNDDMRRISAWVAIAAVPTMLAGIWGMNFEHMPELGWTFGYPLALAFMATCCMVLYRSFKRSGWL